MHLGKNRCETFLLFTEKNIKTIYMKQLYYALVNLLRGHGSNITKVISLTLGLLVGIILFARVAFELSFNTGYKESDKLMVILATHTLNGVPGHPIQEVMAPVPEAIRENFPEEVKSATLTRNLGNAPLYVGEQRFTAHAIMTDKFFFETMGITVTSGSAEDLAIQNLVFVSEDFARKTYATTDVIGKTYMYDKSQEYTIRGTFKEVDDNNFLRPDVVTSIAGYPHYMGWNGGAAFQGYIRLHHPEDMQKINQKIDAVINHYMPYNTEENGSVVQYHLQNMQEEYIREPNRQRLIMVMSFLAFAILIISSMNYVLIAISELPRRAKGVGIHKCNGATTGQVFNIFLFETGIIILISVLLGVLLILNMRGLIQNIIEVNITSLFSPQALGVPGLIIMIVFIIAGVLPGKLFSNVPVSQVFRKYSDRNSVWKRVLLFIQFTGVALVFGLLSVVYVQYSLIINYDHGYSSENIAVAYAEIPNIELAKTTLENLPMVEKTALSELTIGDGWSGCRVLDDNDKQMFVSRITSISPDYIPLYGIPILEGRNIMAIHETLVNQEYVKQMRWTDSAVGKQINNEYGRATIVGVIKDFVDNTLYTSQRPVTFVYMPEEFYCISVKLREPFEVSLQHLNQEAQTLFPVNDVVFESFEKTIQNRYESVKRFRNSALIAFFAILFITLMGLLGYINDEMQRRSKEIAVRKVNGANSWSIINLLSREISIVALPAIITGLVISYFIGREWLLQFAATRVELSIPLYILLCIILLLVIILSVIIKSWRIANENPVISLRSE